MTRVPIQYPCPAKLKGNGLKVRVTGQETIAGIQTYRCETLRGVFYGNYAQSKVIILQPSEAVTA